MQDEFISSGDAEATSQLDVFSQSLLKKVSESKKNTVITETVPDVNTAEIIHNQLILKGYKVSRYNNILSIYIS